MIRATTRIAEVHDIVAIQEAHGTMLDAREFEATHQDLLMFFSEGTNPNSGGCGIIVTRSFAAHFSDIMFQVIVPGRVVAILCSGSQGAIRIFSVHLVPAWTDAFKKKTIKDIVAAAAPEPNLINIVSGDFNSIRPGEARLHPRSMDRSYPHDPFSDWLEDKFGHFIELHQEDFTRCGWQAEQISVLSRIDRIYADLPTIEAMDRRVAVRTIGQFASKYHLSDHLPVSATIFAPATSPPPARLSPNGFTPTPIFSSSPRRPWTPCPPRSRTPS